MAGTLRKMRTELASPVRYRLPVGEDEYSLNELIGRVIKLYYTGQVFCVNCGRKTKKSFSQGYCFPCSQKLASCDMCIVRPERCHFHEGTCREPEWGEANCMQPHIVYLANTSGLKVGITRHSQIPTRWMDQGASQAIPILKAKSRYLSGLIEVEFAKHIADKTNWRNLLKNTADPIDLITERTRLLTALSPMIETLKQRFSDDEALIVIDDADVVEISYPVTQYPEKITSHNFDKNPEVVGELQGIIGQYLILDTGVINIRKFTGYEVDYQR